VFNKNIQYINIIKSQQNIKINYQILDDNKIIKSEHSTFLLNDNKISNDANIKISTLKKQMTTFTCALCESPSQRIDLNSNTKQDNSTNIYFDTRHDIILTNDEILNDLKFYGNDTIDYLISPFSVLQSIMSDKLEKKSLNILIQNENIYAIILDDDKRYSYSSIKKLPSYNDLINSQFFEDEISKQKLYEEMYLLQIQENISNIIQDFYELNNNSFFIDNTNIYYTIKQLNDEQISTLNTDLLLNINYKQINIDNYIFKIMTKPSISKQSFIKPNKKPKSNKLFNTLLIVFLLSSIFAASIYLYKQKKKNILIKEKLIKKQNKLAQKKLEIAKIEEISLPNHISINNNYKKFITDIFNTIGSDSTLKEIKLLKDESTLVYNFKNENSYELNLKPALLKIYKNSQNILTSKNNNYYTAIIANNNVINPINNKDVKIYKPTKNNTNLSKDDIKKYLEQILSGSTIKFNRKLNYKYETFEYIISQKTNNPKSFFENIEKLNKQYYSIVLKFPIEFIKSNNEINIKYKIIFNQSKTKI